MFPVPPELRLSGRFHPGGLRLQGWIRRRVGVRGLPARPVQQQGGCQRVQAVRIGRVQSNWDGGRVQPVRRWLLFSGSWEKPL